MTREELSFEMYVVLGNALNVLVNGVGLDHERLMHLPESDLRRLFAWLEPVPANGVLEAVEKLPGSDRTLLAAALTLSEQMAGSEAETLLGGPAEVRAEVLNALRTPTETDEEFA